jgi:lipopolysaccharide exporter
MPSPLASGEEQPVSPDSLIANRGIDTAGRSLRAHTARGTIVNGLFQVFLASLTLLKGFIVAAFLTRGQYGIWGILIVGLGTLSWLKDGAISQKYVQQSGQDQEQAFQTAFTLELLACALLGLVMLAALPIIADVYGQWAIVPPGLVFILLVLPISTLQIPGVVFYRRMDFLRQRILGAADPIVAFVATVALAVAGAGYWSLVLGALMGVVAGGFVTIRACPYRLALHIDRDSVREYVSFSWPVTVAGAAGVAIAQASLLITNAALGLAAVGAVTLASQISQYTDGLDAIITTTLYPAICAMRDRTERLFEAFVKSNRLALMWGMPFGVGVAVFAPELVRYVLGSRWHPAIFLIQVFGLTSASHQLGFNWTAFYSARGNTRPMAVVTALVMVSFIAAAIPLTLLYGLDGMGVAVAVMTAVGLLARMFYLVRLFPGFGMLRHTLRATGPTIPAVACTLAMRSILGSPHSLGAAVAELAVYVVVTAAVTWGLERSLLKEAIGYLNSARKPIAGPAAFA